MTTEAYGGLFTSSKRKKNNPRFVPVEYCERVHGDLNVQLSKLEGDMTKVINTLLGEQTEGTLERRGGLVDDIKHIRSKMVVRWRPKEKVAVITAFITAAAAVIIAVLK